MESLYRKYRPLTFDSVVGQEHIVSTLRHAIEEGRLSHAYLFCGPRGTGKTTMARILAKALLCKNADAAREQGASGCMPDGTCSECELIAEGAHPDVYELDAASRTGVDNVRTEIIDSVNFAPVQGAYKVYIIDEVHMLTAAAFNALLKTLEEPPAHVVFILCTTDPQKIIATILSRCQRFDFHRIGMDDIKARLTYVCEQEGFEYDDAALSIVARHARGGMRDALSTLEQLSVFGAGAVRETDARALLGEVSSSVLGDVLERIASRDIASLFRLVKDQVDNGNDVIEFTRDLISHTRDVYVCRVVGADSALFDMDDQALARLDDEAKKFESSDRLARVLTVLDDAALEMRNAPDARLVLEIALSRLVRPESDMTLEALSERVDMLERRLTQGDFAMPTIPGEAAPAADKLASAVTAGAAAEKPVSSASSSAAKAEAKDAAPVSASVSSPGAGDLPWNRSGQSPTSSSTAPQPPAVSAPVHEQPVTQAGPASVPVVPQQHASTATERKPVAVDAAASAAEAQATTDGGELQRLWAEVIARVTKKKPSAGALIQSAWAESDDGAQLIVRLPAGSNFAYKMLGRTDAQQFVLPEVAAVFGDRGVSYVMDGGDVQKASQDEKSSSADGAPKTRVAQDTDGTPKTSSTPKANAAPKTSAVQEANVAPEHKEEITSPEQVPGPSPWSEPVAEKSKASTPASASAAPITARADENARDDRVPYDDAAASPADPDDMPPFDIMPSNSAAKPAPQATSAPAPASASWSTTAAAPSPAPAPWSAPATPAAQPVSQSVPPAAQVPEQPLKSFEHKTDPFNHASASLNIPKNEEELKEAVISAFGASTTFIEDGDAAQ